MPGGCLKHPSFGFPDAANKRCRKHALDGMLNKRTHKNYTCDKYGCKKMPSFGHTKITRCADHKTTHMVNLRNRRYGNLNKRELATISDRREQEELIVSWGGFDFESDLNAILFHAIPQ